MHFSLIRSRQRYSFATMGRFGALCCGSVLTLALSLPTAAQQSVPAPQLAPPADTQQPVEQPAPAPAANAPATVKDLAAKQSRAESITEEELRQQLVGKPLYLRGGYLDNALSFDEHGRLVTHSPQGSYTLSAIEIDKVRLTKHKVELEGLRYGLHFLGALPYEDPANALDRVRITPKKKVVKITIDREIVVTPKKTREPGKAQEGGWRLWGKRDKDEDQAPAAQLPEKSEADQLTDSIAAAPQAERPADATSVTTTSSPAHAASLLKNALDQVFAQGLDERMMAAMPDFWKLYYQAAADKADYRPKDLAVLRQTTVDSKARLLSTFEPASNEFAQANAVAGMALYHAVIGADGKPGEIAVARPIGFGLDESAVDSIRKARFEPAIKDGKPVPVMLDLVVQFRI